VIAASAANLIAQIFDYKWSNTAKSEAFATVPFSISIPYASVSLAVLSFGMISLEFKPALSERILGMISKDKANLLKEY